MKLPLHPKFSSEEFWHMENRISYQIPSNTCLLITNTVESSSLPRLLATKSVEELQELLNRS